MNKEIAKGKYWLHLGCNWKRFGLGFAIDRYSVSIDLGPFWFGLEF